MQKGVRQDIPDRLLDKKSLRKYFKELRNQLSEEEWKIRSRLINTNIYLSPFYKNFTKLGFYYPINREVDIRPILFLAISEKEVYLPRTDIVKKELIFYRVLNVSDLKPGAFGIPEPAPDGPGIDINELEVIFIPGIAFDRQKGRLGYGGGFYDRVLSDYRGIKIGIAFSFQIVDELPLEEHDIRVDFLITEEGVL